MDPIGSIKLRWLHGALHDVTYELARSQFHFPPHTWEPAINAYRCEKCIRICVDLAGVERSQIDLIVEAQRVLIRGTRELFRRRSAFTSGAELKRKNHLAHFESPKSHLARISFGTGCARLANASGSPCPRQIE